MLLHAILTVSGLAYISVVGANSPQMTAAPAHIKRIASPGMVKRNDPAYTPYGYIYIGCYYSKAAGDVNLGAYGEYDAGTDATGQSKATVETCAGGCAAGPYAPYRYMGVQDIRCYCDGILHYPTIYHESDCNEPCPGNPDEFCGSDGNDRVSVYEFQGIPNINVQNAQNSSYTLGYGTVYPQVTTTITSGASTFTTTIATAVFYPNQSLSATGVVEVVLPTPSPAPLAFSYAPAFNANVSTGNTVNLQYSAEDYSIPVTIILLHGPDPSSLQPVGYPLTTSAINGGFTWTVASNLTTGGGYALLIRQPGSDDNYSPTFNIVRRYIASTGFPSMGFSSSSMTGIYTNTSSSTMAMSTSSSSSSLVIPGVLTLTTTTSVAAPISTFSSTVTVATTSSTSPAMAIPTTSSTNSASASMSASISISISASASMSASMSTSSSALTVSGTTSSVADQTPSTSNSSPSTSLSLALSTSSSSVMDTPAGASTSSFSVGVLTTSSSSTISYITEYAYITEPPASTITVHATTPPTTTMIVTVTDTTTVTMTDYASTTTITETGATTTTDYVSATTT